MNEPNQPKLVAGHTFISELDACSDLDEEIVQEPLVYSEGESGEPLSPSIPQMMVARNLIFRRIPSDHVEKWSICKDTNEVARVKILYDGRVMLDFPEYKKGQERVYSTSSRDMSWYSRQFKSQVRREKWMDFVAGEVVKQLVNVVKIEDDEIKKTGSYFK